MKLVLITLLLILNSYAFAEPASVKNEDGSFKVTDASHAVLYKEGWCRHGWN